MGRSSGISLANKNQTVSLHLYEPPNMIKFKQTESRMTVARGWAEERRGLVFNGYRVSVMQDEKNRVLEVDVDGGYSGTTM